jgi:ubiquinone/menaquinone biosynthesis C-methylase UbiE
VVKLRLRPERFIVGLRGLALLRGWPFEDPEEADAQLEAIRELLTSRDEDGSTIPEVEEFDVGRAYAWWSETYDSPNPLIAAEEPVVRELLGALEPGIAVDVATGTGRLARLLETLGHRVVALDASAEMLNRARASAPDIRLARADIQALPIRAGDVDLVTCALALTHTRALNEAIAEFGRVLRPGGRLLVSDIHPLAVATGAHAFFERRDGSRGVARNWLHWPNQYVEAFRSAGLTIERLAEPAFGPMFLEEMPEGALRDAARDAVVGLPFALVWLTKKTG